MQATQTQTLLLHCDTVQATSQMTHLAGCSTKSYCKPWHKPSLPGVTKRTTVEASLSKHDRVSIRQSVPTRLHAYGAITHWLTSAFTCYCWLSWRSGDTLSTKLPVARCNSCQSAGVQCSNRNWLGEPANDAAHTMVTCVVLQLSLPVTSQGSCFVCSCSWASVDICCKQLLSYTSGSSLTQHSAQLSAIPAHTFDM